MACGSVNNNQLQLPPGFSFSPSDEELVLHFLYSKASLPASHPNIIPELDLSLLYPWELTGKALSSGNQHYFFTKVVKEKRSSTENGYWKEIGVTEPIVSGSEKVGMKKYLVFNAGGTTTAETTWLMQQYHICGRRKSDEYCRSKWVLCKAYEKKSYGDDEDHHSTGTELSWLDEFYMSLDDDDDDDPEEVISLPMSN